MRQSVTSCDRIAPLRAYRAAATVNKMTWEELSNWSSMGWLAKAENIFAQSTIAFSYLFLVYRGFGVSVCVCVRAWVCLYGACTWVCRCLPYIHGRDQSTKPDGFCYRCLIAFRWRICHWIRSLPFWLGAVLGLQACTTTPQLFCMKVEYSDLVLKE